MYKSKCINTSLAPIRIILFTFLKPFQCFQHNFNLFHKKTHLFSSWQEKTFCCFWVNFWLKSSSLGPRRHTGKGWDWFWPELLSSSTGIKTTLLLLEEKCKNVLLPAKRGTRGSQQCCVQSAPRRNHCYQRMVPAPAFQRDWAELHTETGTHPANRQNIFAILEKSHQCCTIPTGSGLSPASNSQCGWRPPVSSGWSSWPLGRHQRNLQPPAAESKTSARRMLPQWLHPH